MAEVGPPDFVVCPETLGPLEPAEEGLWSPRAERLYPRRRELTFMGFPSRDEEEIRTTMQEERAHQGLGSEVAVRNREYLEKVAPRAVDYINRLIPFVANADRQPRALELGCGNGWFSFLLAEAGFDTWLCDFEANTLATGAHLRHPNLGEEKRFVTDARFAPFAGGSMDLVVFKEFVHHVADFKTLFREANRVLRPGGTMAMMEPVRSVLRALRELRHPDPHEGHHITWFDSYRRAVRRAGFEIVHETPLYDSHGNTRQPTAWMKRKAIAAIDEDHPTGNLLSRTQIRLLGGAQMILIARKDEDRPPEPRPRMSLIDPSTLVIADDEIALYEEFPTILRDAARDIERPAGTHL